MNRDHNLGCDWYYKGQPCDLVRPILREGQVAAWVVNTGVGPDIKAEFSDLLYDIKKN